MKKKIGIISICMSLILGLCACTLPFGDLKETKGDTNMETPVNSIPSGTEGEAVLSEAESQPEPIDYVVEFTVMDGSDASKYAFIEGKNTDGSIRWNYKSDKAYLTELTVVEDLGEHYIDGAGWRYYLNVGGTIICLGLQGDEEGKVVWTNEDYLGASSQFLFDEEDNLFIGGYYGPEVMRIDTQGKAVFRNDFSTEDFFFLTGMEFLEDGNLKLTFDSNTGYLIVDSKEGNLLDSEVVNAYDNDDHCTVVDNVEDMMKAVQDNWTVALKMGEYNLSQWAEEHCDEYPLWDYSYGQAEPYPEKGIYLYDEFDGYEVIFCGYENLSFVSYDGDEYNRPELVVEPRYATVLTFYNCKEITLQDFFIGHTYEMGECVGNVVDFKNVTNAFIYHCNLYGCGAVGVYADTLGSLYINDSNIYSCSYYLLELMGVENFSSINTEYYDGGYGLFAMSETNANFISCQLSRSYGGDVIYMDDVSTAHFSDCLMDMQACQNMMHSPFYNENFFVE